VSAILGVDVGGSGLRAQRVEVTTGSTESLESHGAAITAVGIDVEPLLAAVESFDSRHQHRPDVVVWSMRGLLGLSDPEHVLRQVHSRLGARRTVVASDAVTSLVGALGEVRPGAVLAVGSGVVAFATDFADVWRLVDGWGHVLADRGSGAWLGLEGLRAALATEDHVPGGSTFLHEAAVQVWGEPRSWPRAVMTTPDAQARLAAFAPVVSSLSRTDVVSAGILARSAVHLVDSLEAAASSLHASPPSAASVALTAIGGLLKIPEVNAAFENEVRRRGIELTQATGTALDGALALGRQVGEGRALAARAPYLLCSA